jgi:two-component system sensor histidine kinase DegS
LGCGKVSSLSMIWNNGGLSGRQMLSIIPLKSSENIIRNPHFWAILVISLALIFIYQAWPWRPSNVGPWFPWLSPLYNLALVEVINHIVGILFLIPIIYAAVVFSWQGALVAYLLSLLGVLPIMVDIWSVSSLITNIVFLLLPFLVVSIVAFELAWRRKERKTYAEREAERKVYISKILESQENERLRIAQELHDDTIQTLLIIANRAQKLIPAGNSDMKEAKKNAEWIRDATLQAVEDVRRTSLDLRPSVLDDLGLVPALRWLVDRTNKESGINIRILVDGTKRNLSPEAEVTIFRITQEALNNIKRHSKATEAVITLEFNTECLKITLDDNGQGFRPPKKLDRLAARGKLGLIGMRQRIDFLGGTFQIRSRPGEGTRLLIETKY